MLFFGWLKKSIALFCWLLVWFWTTIFILLIFLKNIVIKQPGQTK